MFKQVNVAQFSLVRQHESMSDSTTTQLQNNYLKHHMLGHHNIDHSQQVCLFIVFPLSTVHSLILLNTSLEPLSLSLLPMPPLTFADKNHRCDCYRNRNKKLQTSRTVVRAQLFSNSFQYQCTQSPFKSSAILIDNCILTTDQKYENKEARMQGKAYFKNVKPASKSTI